MNVIEFSGATICNGENAVVHNFNISVGNGELVYITGKVGTGKTSIIRTIIAENKLGSGKASVCGYDLTSIKENEIPYLRRKIGVVFQDFQLLMDRTVYDNLLFVLKATGWKNRDEQDRRISDVLKAVGMHTKAHKMPHQLSGGEQQRISIARAILNDPKLIIADEPTGNLDEETADGILRLMMEINRRKNTAILMVTHNLSIVRRYPGRHFVCDGEHCREV